MELSITVDLFLIGSSADGACHVDDLECFNEDRLGMEAIRSLHRQLDDDDNGNIDLSESDDVSIPTGLKCINNYLLPMSSD